MSSHFRYTTLAVLLRNGKARRGGSGIVPNLARPAGAKSCAATRTLRAFAAKSLNLILPSDLGSDFRADS
jgi:hypothetical protein